MATAPVLIAGKWREANFSGSFRAENPATKQPLPEEYPTSTWDDCEAALEAATKAFHRLRAAGTEPLANFLDLYAAVD